MPTIELRDRTVHTSASGMEIIRTFHVRPYDAHPAVLKSLQGSVDANNVRTPPARDPYIPTCYCTEARVNFAHEDAAASVESIDNLVGGVNDPDPTLVKLEGGGRNQAKQKETTALGTAGAIVEAHYRPLISAWDPTDADAANKRFDWLDPTFTPGVRHIPWPQGLYVNAEMLPLFPGAGALTIPEEVPQEVGSPIGVPVSDVSIRRILVGKIPWDAIKEAEHAINKGIWPAAGSKVAGRLPTFEPGTLRFKPPNIRNMLDTEGNRWYEITLNFEWLQLYAPEVYKLDGTSAPGWVTWDHVFMQPEGIVASAIVGWYPVYRGKKSMFRNILGKFPQFPVWAGNLHNHVNFDSLFE